MVGPQCTGNSRRRLQNTAGLARQCSRPATEGRPAVAEAAAVTSPARRLLPYVRCVSATASPQCTGIYRCRRIPSAVLPRDVSIFNAAVARYRPPVWDKEGEGRRENSCTGEGLSQPSSVSQPASKAVTRHSMTASLFLCFLMSSLDVDGPLSCFPAGCLAAMASCQALYLILRFLRFLLLRFFLISPLVCFSSV